MKSITEQYECHGHMCTGLEDSEFLAERLEAILKKSQIKTKEIRLFFWRMKFFIRGHRGNTKLHVQRKKHIIKYTEILTRSASHWAENRTLIWILFAVYSCLSTVWQPLLERGHERDTKPFFFSYLSAETIKNFYIEYLC